MAEYELFGGKILEDGSLSNARFLSDEVSPKFLDDANPWVRFAGKFTREDFSQRGWKWESDNNNEQRKQFEFVTAILATQYLHKFCDHNCQGKVWQLPIRGQ